MVSIDAELGAIKRDPLQLLDRNRILELCEESGYRPEADGKLDPPTLLALFMRQIAAGNVSCDQVRLMGGDGFSASGYCQARMRLPLAVIRTLAREVYQKISASVDRAGQHRWRGHRVLLMDSTNFSMPDTPELQAHFGQPGAQKAGCGFPVAHLLLLFNARTGLAVDAITAPLRTHEMSLASGTRPHRRFHAQPALHRAAEGGQGQGRQGAAAFALGQVAGDQRSDRGMVQAGQPAPVDDGGTVEATARDADRA